MALPADKPNLSKEQALECLQQYDWKSDQMEITRFQYDYEFLQSLTNHQYLKHIRDEGYFEQPAFVNYLQHLTYWRKPEFLKYLRVPRCLDLLDSLLNPDVRAELKNDKFLFSLE